MADLHRTPERNPLEHPRVVAALRLIHRAATTVAPEPVKHFVSYDAPISGRLLHAACGVWVEAGAVAFGYVTCPACLAEQAQTADDVFGEADPSLDVHSSYPTKGSRR